MLFPPVALTNAFLLLARPTPVYRITMNSSISSPCRPIVRPLMLFLLMVNSTNS